MIDDPDVSIDELMEIIPGPDFPTGGMICGRSGIRRGYLTGRGTIVVRARAHDRRAQEGPLPDRRQRDSLSADPRRGARKDRGSGQRRPDQGHLATSRDDSDLKEPVRIVIELKRDADPDVVLNQLYQFSPLQDTFSIILLALVDGKPRTLTLKEMLEEFLRHRVIVIRRRTQFLLAKARRRKHTVEGLAAGPGQHRRDHPHHPRVGDAGRGQGRLDGRRSARPR